MYINNPGHMTKMAAMPIYGKKTFKNLLLQNQWTDFNKTWHEALVLQTLQCVQYSCRDALSVRPFARGCAQGIIFTRE